eukprot:scaffold188_cov107-Isochrysis_galbana.AAC.25
MRLNARPPAPQPSRERVWGGYRRDMANPTVRRLLAHRLHPRLCGAVCDGHSLRQALPRYHHLSREGDL